MTLNEDQVTNALYRADMIRKYNVDPGEDPSKPDWYSYFLIGLFIFLMMAGYFGW
jgi:hypothetical protein